MEQSKKFWTEIVHGIEDMNKAYPGKPLAICASPQTVELLKSNAKVLTTAELTAAATICGLDIFEFEEIPEGQVIIQTREWVMQMLKHRVAWLEWMRHG